MATYRLLSALEGRMAVGINGSRDLREELFQGISEKLFTAHVVAAREGVVSGSDDVSEEAHRLGLILGKVAGEGTWVREGEVLASFRATPKQVAAAEEVLLGILAKTSGIATAARAFVGLAGERPRVVCGAWKKMPPQLKNAVRRAVVTGGAHYRITPEPFVYLDKNYVRMLGGIREALEAASKLKGLTKVIQVKGETGEVALEACEAAGCGAGIIFIDTGNREDIRLASEALRAAGLRDRVRIAFAGNVRLEDVAELKSMDVDILDVGRAIVDAPLLDMRLDVVGP